MLNDILKYEFLLRDSMPVQRTYASEGTVCILYKTSYIVSHYKCNDTYNDSQLQSPCVENSLQGIFWCYGFKNICSNLITYVLYCKYFVLCFCEGYSCMAKPLVIMFKVADWKIFIPKWKVWFLIVFSSSPKLYFTKCEASDYESSQILKRILKSFFISGIRNKNIWKRKIWPYLISFHIDIFLPWLWHTIYCDWYSNGLQVS